MESLHENLQPSKESKIEKRKMPSLKDLMQDRLDQKLSYIEYYLSFVNHLDGHEKEKLEAAKVKALKAIQDDVQDIKPLPGLQRDEVLVLIQIKEALHTKGTKKITTKELDNYAFGWEKQQETYINLQNYLTLRFYLEGKNLN